MLMIGFNKRELDIMNFNHLKSQQLAYNDMRKVKSHIKISYHAMYTRKCYQTRLQDVVQVLFK